MTGERISHYEIQDKLGSGGMGDVWKAHDTVLKRAVALKVMNAESGSDPKRRARMIEEARAAASLNHTNIASLYDVIQEENRDILVMEYVPGLPLDEYTGGKPLKTRTAIDLAGQIADGLAAAHRIGLAHRDLKPSNLIVTKQNTVKILDFGIAKRVDPPGAAATDPNLTRTAVALTERGQVIGTPAYMSPEQAEAVPLDTRTDIFSFGIVLYEMLAGKSPFVRETRTATLNAVVHEDAPPIEGLSRPLQRLLSACLQKDPARRLQSLADVRLFLEAASESGTSITSGEMSRVVPRRRLPIGLIAGLAIGAAIAWLVPRSPASKTFTPVRVTVDGQSFDPAISPDGKLVTYSSDRAEPGNRDIFAHDVETGSAIRLTSEPTAEHRPVFSADGSQIYFFSNRKPPGVYAMSRLGGEARLIVAGVGGVEPSPDGKWLAFVRQDKLLVRSVGGGEPKALFQDDNLPASFRWYTDSRRLVLNASGAGGSSSYTVIDTQTGTVTKAALREKLVQQEFEGNATPIGFLDDNTFLTSILHRGVRRAIAVEWSPRNPASVGAIRMLTASNEHDFGGRAVAGRIVLNSGSERTPVWALPGDVNNARPTGNPSRFVTSSEYSGYTSINRDQTTLAYTTDTARFDQAWVEDLATRKRRQVATTPFHQYAPTLNAAGTRVLFGRSAPGGYPLHAASLSGGEAALVCEDCGILRGWSADERYVLYSGGKAGRRVVSVLDMQSKTKSIILEHPGGGVANVRLSPNERHLAFVVFVDGHPSLYVAPFRANQPLPVTEWIQVPVPHTTISSPFWSSNGQWVYYFAGEIDQPNSQVLAARRWDAEAKRVTGEEVIFARFGRSSGLPPPVANANTPAAASDRIFVSLDESRRDVWILDSTKR